MEVTAGDILVLPSSEQGHLNPCVELCKYLCPYTKSRVVLIIPSNRSSYIPSALHPSIEVEVLQVEQSPPPTESEGNRPDHARSLKYNRRQQLVRGLSSFLSKRYNVPGKTQPGCVVVDYRKSWCRGIFLRENVPVFPFFTFSAVHAAMRHAEWKAHANGMKPGEARLPKGLPECVTFRCYSDTHTGRQLGFVIESDHREQVRAPGWLEYVNDFKALLINTCYELEGPFLDYLANHVDKPVFGIGPLLPEAYWRSTETLCRDRDSRSSNRKSNYTEDEVIQWLDSKPSQSVIYISFGSTVAPTMIQEKRLAFALRESRREFILVIQPGSRKPVGLQKEVGKRGLIITGWAPQLLILSHPSTGGFLSHCGWNSSMEAIGRGVPILAWPIMCDQFYNAKLVVDYLKIGTMAEKSDILQGIDRLMEDKEARERAKNLSRMFELGLPSTSKASIKTWLQYNFGPNK